MQILIAWSKCADSIIENAFRKCGYMLSADGGGGGCACAWYDNCHFVWTFQLAREWIKVYT